MLVKNIREQIVNRAKEKNLSIMALEEKARINKGTANNIVHNKSLNPTIETLYAIAEVFECTVNDLIANPSDTNSQPPKDYELEVSLFWDTVECTLSNIKAKNIPMSMESTLSIIKQAYIFLLTKKNKKIDKEFIEWLIDNRAKEPL